ncbi:nitric oxide reductase NorQ protein [Desulfosarcina sp. BuS5]|uniref:AAA family ATPase n=1 Tax=Desulfosarcina sp. BuS5 TaxID=933262 RepID=UPI000A4347B4|nr:MoxR family ATPase [Desulfosarcina sp. BuS5]WDN88376.1 nitric oxide reductase NorQ protein [Desulfosarcina sp. BuS5]
MDKKDSLQDVLIPENDPHYFLSREIASTLDRFNNMSASTPVNLLVVGKQGCGKSSLVSQFAARHQRPLATFQVGILSEPGQLFGELRLKDGETYYQQFLFPQAISTPNCVIHLEEINRPEHPKALNMLFSILSDDRQAWLDDLGNVKVADGVVFFATLNEGEEFSGTEMLDAALRDRFYVISMDYLPLDVEKEVLIRKTGLNEVEAQRVVSILNDLRYNTKMPMAVSTRHSLMIGNLVKAGASIREALIFSLQMSKEALEAILLTVQMELGEKEVPKDAYELY